MSWILFSLLGALGQALGTTYKKKSLTIPGLNNTLGLVAYAVAGTCLFLLWGLSRSFAFPIISQVFVLAAFITILLNVVASWCMYRVLDVSDISKLLPFMSLTALLMVPIEYFLRGVFPNGMQILGMILVVLGGIIFAGKGRPSLSTIRAAKYFGVTLLCYSITSPYMAVMQEESREPLFSGAVMHLGMAIGFIPLVIWSKEKNMVLTLHASGNWGKVFRTMCIAGLIVAFLENGPIFMALETANASEVFALKRTMPIFALLLGNHFFNEKVLKKHVFAAVLMVIGSMAVVWFK